MKTYALGDVHGNFKALQQVLKKANFDYDQDELIFLGDVADGYPEVPECIEEFRKIRNFTWILGNHDEWTQRWFKGEFDMKHVGLDGEYSHPYVSNDTHMWLSQGGQATFSAYMKQPHLIAQHRNFWLEQPVLYTVLDHTHKKGDIEYGAPKGGRCFVHGGFARHLRIDWQAKYTPHVLYWDRDLLKKGLSCVPPIKLKTEDNFDEIFVGHTATTYWNKLEPMYGGGIWNLDTGAGWSGRLTLMDIYTKEYHQSDLAEELYPGVRPRG